MEIIKTLKLNKKELKVKIETDADRSVFEEIFLDHDYKDLDQLITNAKAPILDIGGHIGLFAIYCATLNSNVTITSFEPDPRNYQLMKENIKLNRIKNVHTKQLAIADKAGEIEFFPNEDSHNHSIVGGLSALPPVKCQASTLAQIAKESAYSLLKLDCEGAEFAIIPHADRETLAKFQHIYLEYHLYAPHFQRDQLTNSLKNAGFHVTTAPSHYDKRFGFILAKR